MSKLFNYFNEVIINYFSNGGDKKSIVSFSGGYTDFFTILGLMIYWSIGFDVMKIDWLYDFSGIILGYLLARIFGIIITGFVLPGKITKNQRKRYLKAKFWLLIPFILVFFIAFFGDQDSVSGENNWEGDTWGTL